MDKLKEKIDFQLMVLTYKLRDLFSPREKVLSEVAIEAGFRLLDYGCGPGGHIVPAARLVGKSGHVYAVDIQPDAVQRVQRIASRRQLANVEAICSNCNTGLPGRTADVVLLYDTFHDLSDPGSVLRELHRVLKPDGMLSFSDHHMKEDEILAKVTGDGLFRFVSKGKQTYAFRKRGD